MPRRPVRLTCPPAPDKATDRAEGKALRARLPAPISATASRPGERATAAATEAAMESQPADSVPSRWFTADPSSRKLIRAPQPRSEEHTSELQSPCNLV